jgi:fructoselysine-6-P-deglycase FrlB-like protein
MRKLPESMQLDDMRNMVSHFPQMLRNFNLNQEIIQVCRNYHKEGIEGLCFLGMGGSSIVGSYVKEILSRESRIPIEIVRNYFLPKWISRDWIVVAISYSGNTEETLTSLSQAKKRGSKIVTITSGWLKNMVTIPKFLFREELSRGQYCPYSFPRFCPFQRR